MTYPQVGIDLFLALALIALNFATLLLVIRYGRKRSSSERELRAREIAKAIAIDRGVGALTPNTAHAIEAAERNDLTALNRRHEAMIRERRTKHGDRTGAG